MPIKPPTSIRMRNGRTSWHPQAFTLIEMLVSLTVLALALTVVGVVFRVTTQTATQSAAYTETHTWVRQFISQIKEDLRGCDPAQSVLVLVGRTQAAALTADDLAAGKYHRVLVGDATEVPPGYDPAFTPEPTDPNATQYSNPRADILMFFTNRATSSRAPNPAAVNDPYASGAKFAPVRVVYGHAALGSPDWTGNPPRFPAPETLRHIGDTRSIDGRTMSTLPANAWHLSRVATIVQAPPSPRVFDPRDVEFWPRACDSVARGEWYTDERGAAMPGDAAILDKPAYNDMLDAGAAMLSPYQLTPPVWPESWVAVTRSLVFATGKLLPQPRYHVATVLDEVPIELQSNLAVHMLPGCVWFQVEFLMPEDPRNSIEFTDPNKVGEFPRWVEIQPGQMYVFIPDTAANRQAVASQVDVNGVPLPNSRLAMFARVDQIPANDTAQPGTAVSNRIIRMWPYAIRVTVRVYDSRGRLTEPIVRSVVHRFE